MSKKKPVPLTIQQAYDKSAVDEVIKLDLIPAPQTGWSTERWYVVVWLLVVTIGATLAGVVAHFLLRAPP